MNYKTPSQKAIDLENRFNYDNCQIPKAGYSCDIVFRGTIGDDLDLPIEGETHGVYFTVADAWDAPTSEPSPQMIASKTTFNGGEVTFSLMHLDTTDN